MPNGTSACPKSSAVVLDVLESVRLRSKAVLDAGSEHRSGAPKRLEPTVDRVVVEAVSVEAVPNQGNELLVVLVGGSSRASRRCS